MPHQIGVFGNFTAVDADFALVFVNVGLNGNVSVAVLSFRDDTRRFRADTNELFVVANPKRRARTEIKNRFGAVGFALRVLPEQDVQPFRKIKFFVLVITEILKK